MLLPGECAPGSWLDSLLYKVMWSGDYHCLPQTSECPKELGQWYVVVRSSLFVPNHIELIRFQLWRRRTLLIGLEMCRAMT